MDTTFNAGPPLTARERFLGVFKSPGECFVDRPPVWLMRQAGRYLPEYRQLREQYGFLQLVQTPALATEVTLQPLRRFDLDAAILFSDILVIPEALGQGYHFADKGGIGMDWTISGPADLERLRPHTAILAKLDYVKKALQLLRVELPHTALLGFGGSPWTLATYMIEGGSSKDFLKIKHFYWQEPQAFEALMERLTQALIAYFELQIDAGVDAIQIFDTWGSLCPYDSYWDASLRWIQQVVKALKGRVPILLYSKNMAQHAALQQRCGVSGLSLDWTAPMAAMRKSLPASLVLQGNLDPALLCTRPELVASHTRALLDSLQGHSSVIINLGHGMLPQAKIECVEALVHTVTGR